MATFLLFLVVVAIYVAFLLWCLAPLARWSKRPRGRWLRVLLGLLLLSANLSPLLALPVMLLISVFSHQALERFIAVALFPRTLPIYVLNVRDRASASATMVEVAYPIEIGGVRYAPVVRTACTPRRMIDLGDFGINIQYSDQYPTASGGEFVGQAGNATIALDASSQLCPPALRGRLRLGVYPDYRASPGTGLKVYVVRGEADKVAALPAALLS